MSLPLRALARLRRPFLPPERALATAIGTHWPLDRVEILRPLQERGGRRVLAIESRQGRFVAKIAAGGKSEAEIERDTAALDYLQHRGFGHTPALLRTRAGKTWARIDDRHAYLMELVEGRVPRATATHWFELGEIVARLHGFTDFPAPTSFDYPTIKAGLLADASLFPFADEYRALVESLPDFTQYPAALINTDIGLRNSILRPDGRLILIDWDDAGHGPMIFDLGFPLICQFISSRRRFCRAKARAFYRGYESVRPMSESEKGALFAAGLLFALFYTKYGRIGNNWRRIVYALGHRDEIDETIHG